MRLDAAAATVAVGDERMGIAWTGSEWICDRSDRDEQGMAARVGGTGLGLTNARESAQHHRERLWVESEVGKCSTLFLQTPLAQPEVACVNDRPKDDGCPGTARGAAEGALKP
jgi:signal transduction histidine kinase